MIASLNRVALRSIHRLAAPIHRLAAASSRRTWVACAATFAFLAASSALAADSPPAPLVPPRVAEVRAQIAQWLAEAKADPAVRASVDERFAALSEEPGELALLEAVVASAAAVDDRAGRLAVLCAKPKDQYVVPPQDWLADSAAPRLVANNLRLHFARWLVHAEMYDEAREQLSELAPGDVVAPATLLFYRGVAEHMLLEKEAGLETLERLLRDGGGGPKRYIALARLMREDLDSLDDESLDHIARRMGDVRRRLELGRAGKRVREQEDGIIESLDKLIKQLEEQQQQANASGADNIRSDSPAKDSVPMGGKGPGETDKRAIGASADWGSLPPAEREKALLDISRDFPPHFRDVMEQYFRRLAEEDSK